MLEPFESQSLPDTQERNPFVADVVVFAIVFVLPAPVVPPPPLPHAASTGVRAATTPSRTAADRIERDFLP
jgi:hypothetical protein